MKLSSLCIAVASALYASGAMATDINNNETFTLDYLLDDRGTATGTRVGYQTDGTLNIEAGGELITYSLGLGEGATGTVNVRDGGKVLIEHAPGLIVPMTLGGKIPGVGGTGILNVSGEGSLVTVQGSPDQWNNFGYRVYMGAGNSFGVINITDGGKIHLENYVYMETGVLNPPGREETNSIINIDGAGSELRTHSSLYIGMMGFDDNSNPAGRLAVTNGGLVHSDITIEVGSHTSNENNLMTVDGAGSVASAGVGLVIGSLGRGTAVFSNGGTLISPLVDLGDRVRESGSGELAVGARSGDTAVAPGVIDTQEILFSHDDTVLTLNHTSQDFVLGADLSGDSRAGEVRAESGVSILTGNNSAFGGSLNIASPATLVVSEQQNLGSSDIILTGGTLQIDTTQDWFFGNTLSGQGTVTVDTSGHNFTIFQGAGESFRGTLALQNSYFTLGYYNTYAISKAQLNLGEGSVVTVGEGRQSIGGLVFDGGTLDFGEVSPGQTESDRTVHTTDTLDLSGQGTVQVTPGAVSNDTPTPDTHIALLQQDDANTLVQLVSTDGDILGTGGSLVLTDQNGTVISDAVESAVTQGGETVATGTYDYRLTSGENNDGLYISYGLKQLDLLGTGDSALVLNTGGNTGNAADLSARVTGNGDLAVDSQPGQTVSLSNADNDYTGVTEVRDGNLLMQNDNVLGQSRELRLAAGTGFDMNGHSQTLGQLSAAGESVLNLNGGSLTLTHGGTAGGVLTGSGELNVSGDTLTVTGANDTLTATTTIADGARVLMNTTLGLGTGDIVAAGTLSLDGAAGTLHNSLRGGGLAELNNSDVVLVGNNSAFTGQFSIDADSQLTASTAENLGSADVSNTGSLVLNSDTDWQLNNDVYGSGRVTKLGAGSVTVGDNAAWTGQTDIAQGGLVLGDGTTPVTLASTRVNIAAQGMLSGTGGVAGDVNNAGLLLAGTGTEAHPVRFTVGGSLVNSGTLATGMKGQAAGNHLVVNGSYTGNDGHLSLNTALEGDDAVTDKLIVKGDTSGKTSVSVTNAGGSGAATLDGIEVIHVDGQSDGEFTQAGRIVAGAYDYTLGRGQDDNSGNWYLTSGKTHPDPDPKPEPEPEPEPKPEPGKEKDLRPEGGSYTANLAAANSMFVTRLHDRLGETQYIDALTGEKKVTSMWMRQAGGHNRWRDGSGQLKTQGNRYVLQMGGDIAQWSQTGLDRWHLGVMAGYGNDHSTTKSSRTGYQSKGSVNGYSAGVYATWYANDETHQGAYLDSWAQYSWFDNDVQGSGLQGESYKSKGITASLEAGYTRKLGEFSGSKGSVNEWYIQPQAQAVWMGVEADDHREINGTRVSSSGDGNVQTRLGVKTWMKGHNRMDEGKGRDFQPFAEVNWIHNTRDFGTAMNGVTVRQDGAKNLGEVKVGVEGQMSPRLNLWGNVGVQVGDKGYNDSSAMVGVKWNF